MLRRLLLLALAAIPASAQELTGTQLQKVKDATVYVKHVAFRGLETGSGYLFRKDGKTGWILTCEHVVRDTDSPTIVLRSGREGELKVEAHVVAVDKERDLACLRFTADDIPAPIELSAKTDVKETETVYASGFPFGPSMSTAGDNPAPSVTKISVSAVRRDELGECVIVQLSGDVNPGNSGGPVLDSKCRLVGLATSRIQGTEMVFAVPTEGLKTFLKGRVQKPVAATGEPPAGKLGLKVSAAVFDPLDKLQQSGVAWVRKDAVKETPAAGTDGKWKAAAASMREIPVKMDDATGIASGSLEFAKSNGDGDAVEVLLQAWWVGADGVKTWGEPVAATAKAK